MCLALAGVGTVGFTGRNGAGSISVTGLNVGDNLLVIRVDGGGNQLNPSDFAANVSTANQIQQQSGADYSAVSFIAIVIRGS